MRRAQLTDPKSNRPILFWAFEPNLEIDQYSKFIPDPMPAGYEAYVEWGINPQDGCRGWFIGTRLKGAASSLAAAKDDLDGKSREQLDTVFAVEFDAKTRQKLKVDPLGADWDTGLITNHIRDARAKKLAAKQEPVPVG